MATRDRKVRMLLGTRKGAYTLESDLARKRWKVHGPYQPGGDVFHFVADPRHPGDAYAAVNNSWFGPSLFRARGYGTGRWTELAPPMMSKSSERPPPGNEGPPPRPITNLWHIEPGLASEPESILLGVDPGGLYRSEDLGESWSPVDGLNAHPTRSQWNPGAGGLCTHTILLDPTRPKRLYAGISAAGVFRSDDGGGSFAPKNVGVKVSFLPEKEPIVGQCVHHVAMDAQRPETLYRQDHDGIYVSRDSADSWQRIGGSLPTDFGFVVTSPASLPGTAFFVPLLGDSRFGPKGRLQVYRWTEKDRKWAPMISAKAHKWPGELGTHREGIAADGLDPAGLYLGTTTGQVIYSRDAGKSWDAVPYYFPGIQSVSAASPVD